MNKILDTMAVQFMGFLAEIFKKNTVKKSNKEKNASKEASLEKTLNEIWTIEDPSDFVTALSQYIPLWRKYVHTQRA